MTRNKLALLIVPFVLGGFLLVRVEAYQYESIVGNLVETQRSSAEETSSGKQYQTEQDVGHAIWSWLQQNADLVRENIPEQHQQPQPPAPQHQYHTQHPYEFQTYHHQSQTPAQRRQDTLDPALLVALAIGVGNLIATGIAFAISTSQNDDMQSQINRLQTISGNTCSRLRDFTQVTGTTGDAAANKIVLDRLLAISDPTCSA